MVFAITVYSVSLRQQLQDVGKKLVAAQHYNKDGLLNNRQGRLIQVFFIIIIFIFLFFYDCVFSLAELLLIVLVFFIKYACYKGRAK